MSDTLIVLKFSRLRRIPFKNRAMLLVILVVSVALLVGSCFFYPRLTEENTHELTGSITASRIVTRHFSRNSRSKAILVIDGETCTIPIRSRELRQLVEGHPTGVARVIVTEGGDIAELEYDSKLYHTLEKENTDRLVLRIILLISSLLVLAGDLFFFWLELLSYSIVILRKRPKNMQKRLLIEK